LAALRMLPIFMMAGICSMRRRRDAAVRHVEFDMPSAVDVMVDGEVLALQCRTLDIVPRGGGRVHMKRAWLAVRAPILWY